MGREIPDWSHRRGTWKQVSPDSMWEANAWLILLKEAWAMDDSPRTEWVHNQGRAKCFDELCHPFSARCPVAPANLGELYCLPSPEKTQVAPRIGGLSFTAEASCFLSSLVGTEISKVLFCPLSVSLPLSGSRHVCFCRISMCGCLRGEAQRKAAKWTKTATVEATWLK